MKHVPSKSLKKTWNCESSNMDLSAVGHNFSIVLKR